VHKAGVGRAGTPEESNYFVAGVTLESAAEPFSLTGLPPRQLQEVPLGLFILLLNVSTENSLQQPQRLVVNDYITDGLLPSPLPYPRDE
jgi:hypothetical protein